MVITQKKILSLLSFFLATAKIGAQPLPVVLIHGILSDKYAMGPVVDYINKYMPGTYIKNVEIGSGKSTSFVNMFDQVKWLSEILQSDPNLAEGCNIVAHSQGGLIARCFVQQFNNPKVYNLITWGSPHQGIFGTPSKIDDRFTLFNYFERQSYYIFYSTAFQRYVSFASYWHDPFHYDSYIKHCRFLPYLNNQVNHPYTTFFKNNIMRLQNFVLVNSTDEDIIEPYESCQFGFYKRGTIDYIESLYESDLYRNDMLGLKSLHESGRLHLKIAHCSHTDYQEDELNFIENTLPFLLLEPVDIVLPGTTPRPSIDLQQYVNFAHRDTALEGADPERNMLTDELAQKIALAEKFKEALQRRPL